MKILNYCLVSVFVCMFNITHADILAANLSQDNKKISVELNRGDLLSVKYKLNRLPILRNSEWWSYAVWCTASDSSTLEYPLREEIKETTLPALLSNDDDQQKVGFNMDNSGVFKIKNQSQGKLYITCGLYNKFGL